MWNTMLEKQISQDKLQHIILDNGFELMGLHIKVNILYKLNTSCEYNLGLPLTYCRATLPNLNSNHNWFTFKICSAYFPENLYACVCSG
jgi:hypothetical protein